MRDWISALSALARRQELLNENALTPLPRAGLSLSDEVEDSVLVPPGAGPFAAQDRRLDGVV